MCVRVRARVGGEELADVGGKKGRSMPQMPQDDCLWPACCYSFQIRWLPKTLSQTTTPSIFRKVEFNDDHKVDCA
jgi:hypothetical protein